MIAQYWIMQKLSLIFMEPIIAVCLYLLEHFRIDNELVICLHLKMNDEYMFPKKFKNASIFLNQQEKSLDEYQLWQNLTSI